MMIIIYLSLLLNHITARGRLFSRS